MNSFWTLFSDYTCQSDELVLLWVAPRFTLDSLKEERVGGEGFLLCKHNTGDGVVLPEAILGHRGHQLRRGRLSCSISLCLAPARIYL